VKDVELISDTSPAPHTDGRGFATLSIQKGLAVLEGLVASLNGGVNGRYAAGTDAPTIADIALIPQLYNARRFAVDLTS
jgi:glutathione S-transferase